MAAIEEGFCHDDSDCSDKQYCYLISQRCVDYTACNRYNRQENRDRRSRHPSQCGPCLSGYTAEELGTGEMAWLCKKTNVEQNVPDVGKLSSTTIICTTVGGVLFVCMLVMLVGVYLRKRVLKRRSCKPEQCNDLCVMEPSAPPVESSPFIGYGEELSQVSFNNNKNLKDKNNLVRAAGFKPPSWIRTNPNYENNLNVDNMTTMDQLQSVAEIPPTNDQSNAWPSEQLTLEVSNGNLVQYEVEVDNSTNSILVSNSPSSSNENQEEENNNGRSSNTHDSTSSTPGNGERVRASNILISQKISMNVNLLNGD